MKMITKFRFMRLVGRYGPFVIVLLRFANELLKLANQVANYRMYNELRIFI